MRRVLAPLSAAALCLGTLTGCVAAGGGQTGVTVDEQGNPVVVFSLCRDETLEQATITMVRSADGTELVPASTGVSLRPTGRWTHAPHLDAATAERDARAGSWGGWTPADALPPLEPGARYQAEGRLDEGDHWVTATVTFTGADVAGLQPGQVIASGTDATSGAARPVTMSLQEFADRGPVSCP